MNGTNVDHQTLFTYRPNYVLSEAFSHKNRKVNTHTKKKPSFLPLFVFINTFFYTNFFCSIHIEKHKNMLSHLLY